MLQNPRKTLGFKKNMVYKIPPGGGGKPYPASGLEVTERPIAVNLDSSLSYFNKVHNVLSKYQLPTLNELRIKQPTKESWKSTVKEAVNKYWTESLKNEAYEKSSLGYLNIDSMKMGETYSVWKSLDSIVSGVRKGTIKCRVLTRTYML